MSSDRVVLIDPDFISIDGAEKKFGVTAEELSILITEGALTAYILANASSKRKAARLSKTAHRYAKITSISWVGESVDHGAALMMDEAENIITPHIVTYLYGNQYKYIFIKPNDLRSSVNTPVVVKKGKSTRNEFNELAYKKFEEAYHAAIASGKKPTTSDVLSQLSTMSFNDDDIISFPGHKKFTYKNVEIGYSTYKHWFTTLNQSQRLPDL